MNLTNNLSTLLICIVTTTFHVHSSEMVTYLDPSQRPESIKSEIDCNFNRLPEIPIWGYNGRPWYMLGDIDEKLLIPTIINTFANNKKDFYFLDIGAGDFSWGYNIAHIIKNLQKTNLIPSDIHVTIIGVRAEPNAESINDPENPSCTIRNIGRFKIENFDEELKKRNLLFSFDLIVSRWTLRHLVDPTGTFVEIYKRLALNGLFLGDGFFINYPDSPSDEGSNAKKNMELLLANSKLSFLMRLYNEGPEINQFIIQRQTDEPLQIPLAYLYSQYIDPDRQCYSRTVIQFACTPTWEKDISLLPYPYTEQKILTGKTFKSNKQYYGTELSQSLLDWLIKIKLIYPRESNS